MAETEQKVPEELFSEVSPQSLNLEPRVLSVLANKFQLERLTQIQAGSYPPIVAGKDVLMRADTGSGKTLSYLIPIMQKLVVDFPKDTNPITRQMGPLVLIIAPTRELCLQISTVVDKFKTQMPYITPGTLLGGEKVPAEKKRLRKGINILIATPDRMIYHLENSQNLNFNNLKFLVLDEADRLLDMGFLNKVNQIINKLPPRQTILVSATLHESLQRLTELSLHEPVLVGEMKSEDFSVPPTLVQRYVIVPAKWRLTTLAALLFRCSKDIPNMKCIVFMNCCLSVDYHYAFFGYFNFLSLRDKRLKRVAEQRKAQQEQQEQSFDPKKATIKDPHASTDNDEIGNYSPFLKCPIFRIHGNVEQIDRSKTMSKFTASTSAVLFCTDVAARGLDIPDITTIIQYDPPVDTEDYVHRVGRTARIGHEGISYLFLQEFESKFVDLLKSKNIDIREYTYKRLVHKAVAAIGNDDDEICMAAMKKETASTNIDHDISIMAMRAWAASIKAYTSHKRETRYIFNKRELHLGQMAAAFGLENTPAQIKEILHEERELTSASKRPDEQQEKPKYLPSFEERTSEFL